VRTAADAELFLSSLYLPGIAPARYRRAGAYVRVLARFGVELPVPIRRFVAVAARPLTTGSVGGEGKEPVGDFDQVGS
jgi:hypothetical protein